MKGIIKDITGERFGKLVAVSFAYSKNGSYWNCMCDCGNTTVVYLGKLTTGATKSCGCISKTALGLYNERIYDCYKSMIDRCTRLKNIAYHNYGGRGISVCPEWKNSFKCFYEWAMNNGYADNLTIDRIDSDKNYEPSNCRWITKSENTARSNTEKPRNLSKNTYIITSDDGFYLETNNIAKFVRDYIGVNTHSISCYIRKIVKEKIEVKYKNYYIKRKD